MYTHGQTRKVYTRYLIGADGANSSVRKVILESLEEGAKKQDARYTNNVTLEASMTSPEFLLSGLMTLMGEMINRHLPPEDIITLPE